MFYSHSILAKSGPFAHVWLAATWEKKVTRSMIFGTDIATVVESIANPAAPLALRLSANLLVGVVRIYARKARAGVRRGRIRARGAAADDVVARDRPRPEAGGREVLLVVRERDVAHVADAVRRRRRGRPLVRARVRRQLRRPAAAAQRRVEFEVEVQLVEVRHLPRGEWFVARANLRDADARAVMAAFDATTLSAGRSTTPPRNAMRIFTMASLQSFMR